jgi:hypothetical protein
LDRAVPPTPAVRNYAVCDYNLATTIWPRFSRGFLLCGEASRHLRNAALRRSALQGDSFCRLYDALSQLFAECSVPCQHLTAEIPIEQLIFGIQIAKGKRVVQSMPLRESSRTPAAPRRTIMRKPSCLIS